MLSREPRIRTAIAVAIILGVSGATLPGLVPGAAAQEASPTYMDELLRQAQELLDDTGPSRDFAIVILEELVGAGSDEAAFELARILADPAESGFDFGRAEPTLQQMADGEGPNAIGALKLLAENYRNPAQPHYDPSRAVSAYDQAAELGDTGAMIALAEMLASGEGVEDADFQAAAAWLDRAVSVGDDNAPAAAAALATLYRNEGDPEGAADAYRSAAEYGDTSAMTSLATLLADQGEIDAARGMVAEAIASNVENPGEAWEMLADLHLAAGDAPAAVDALRNAVNHDRASAMVRLATMLSNGDGVDQPDPEGAVALLDRAIALDGGHATRAWNALAQLRNDAGDAEGAAAAYRQSADLGDTVGMIRLAAMLGQGEDAEQSDIEAADALLDQAIAGQDGNLGWAWFTRARMHRERGDLAFALAAGLAGADASDTGAMILVAQMLAAGEGVAAPDRDAAAALLERAVEANDGNASWAALTLASLYQNDEASPGARRAFSLAADHGDTASMIRLAALITGDGEGRGLTAATDLLRRAIDAGDSNSTWAWYTMAEVQLAAGDAAGAIESYAVAADAGDPAAMIQLAAMLARGEGASAPDSAAAIDLLQRAIAIEGDHVTWGQWTLADLHMSLAASDRQHLAPALQQYTLLTETGDGRAHLAVAEIMAVERGMPEQWREMTRHYREAARTLGVETVTASMLRLDPKTMYASVQILLTEAGYHTGYVDGIRGRRTDEAIAGFCQDKQPAIGCVSSIVTRGFLGALIEATS